MSSEKPSIANILVPIARRMFDFVADIDGTVYGVRRDGPPIAIPLRGTGPNSIGSVRQTIIREYYREHGEVPGQGGIADAVAMIEALAEDAERTRLHLRVAPDADGDGTWIDLGDATGRAIHITPGAWEVTLPEQPLFRRTKLIGPLPEPVRDPSGWQPGIDRFLELLNVSQETWPLAVGWLLAAMQAGVPAPILFLTGFQGSGKTSGCKLLISLIDPGPAPLRSVPRDEKDLAVGTAAGWVLGLDNISHIQDWLSDALCRIVTGDGFLARSLYSDSDVSVLEFQRPIALTAIDAGALRGDLADRLLRVDLDRITDKGRRSATELNREFAAAHPVILGGLCQLLAEVYSELPTARAQLAERPRMADFAELLAALDRVTGTSPLSTYLDSQEDLSGDVVEGSQVLTALVKFLDSLDSRSWEGKPKDLFDQVTKHAYDSFQPEKHWPRTASVFSSAVKRGAPALIKLGYQVDGVDRKTKINGQSIRWWTLRAPRTQDEPEPPTQGEMSF